MNVTIYKDGVPVGEHYVPKEISDKAAQVRAWMAVNGVNHFCGLTDSLYSHLKIGALEHEIKQLKAQLRKGEN